MFSQLLYVHFCHYSIYSLVQDCSNSIANALEFLQPCTKPSILLYEYKFEAWPINP